MNEPDLGKKLIMNVQIMKNVENLPEKLELTENQWYEYHYYLQKNTFLIKRILDLPYKAKNIYVVEPYETYIGSILEVLGFQVHLEYTYRFQTPEILVNSSPKKKPDKIKEKNFDIILLLNIIECQHEHPALFLKDKSSLLKNGGRLLLTTENIAQFKNRLKLLLGRSIFLTGNDNNLCIYRLFSLWDLETILTNINLKILNSQFISRYPPFKIEPLSLKRYLLKYINYFAMKAVPGFRNEIFIQAEKVESTT